MKTYCILLFIFTCQGSVAQELYVSTEPASNMAKGSMGFRLSSKVFKMNHSGKFDSYRIEPEVMLGINRNAMVHVAAYGSDMFQKNFRVEGMSLYGKYRFFSTDEVHRHFRMAAYARASVIKNPQVLITTGHHLLPDGNGGVVAHEEEIHSQSNDIDLDGSNSGFAAGIIATTLKNRTAVSASAGYTRRINNIDSRIEVFQPLHAINYTASAGYLLFPGEYTDYKQLNCNLYVEVLGQSFMDKSQYYTDIAPAVQFIFNSIARLDIAYRAQLSGNVKRLSNNYVMVRLEYNLLNVF